MEYINLSHEMIDNINVYPGDPKFNLKDISTKEDNYSLSKICGSLHTGTHIDAPSHYITNGKKVKDLDLDTLIGEASVVRTKKEIFNDSIKIEDIDINISNNDSNNRNEGIEKILILNTGWHKYWGKANYFNKNPYISNELAKLLIENEISGIGIDTCSVDKVGKTHIHKKFLKNDIWIVENLTNMANLVKNKYYSYFIPMNISSEASYVRAFVER
jgi:arylformamidase